MVMLPDLIKTFFKKDKQYQRNLCNTLSKAIWQGGTALMAFSDLTTHFRILFFLPFVNPLRFSIFIPSKVVIPLHHQYSVSSSQLQG